MNFKEKIIHLNFQQKKAVETTDESVLVLAGAGSGKTRVITSKIIHLIINKNIYPENILAITFTNKAANEMKERTDGFLNYEKRKKLLIKTFHSWGVFFLRNFIHFLPPYQNNFSIIDDEDKFKIVKELLIKNHYENFTLSNVKEVSNFFSRLKNNFLLGEENNFDQDIKLFYNPNSFFYKLNDSSPQKLYLDYLSHLKDHNLVDFDDLIVLVIKLKNNPVCQEYLSKQWKYVLVDEYQDTNFSQDKIIDWFIQLGSILTLVGDDHQSIYSFRGANVENILNFKKKYPPIKVIKLEENYRSYQSILNLANQIILKNKTIPKKLFSNLGKGEIPFYYQFKFEKEESEWIASDIKEKVATKKISLNQIAIFFRTNHQSRNIEENLVKRNIAYKIIGGISFYQRKEVKNILGYLKLLLNPFDRTAFLRVINFPPRSLGIKSIEKILELNVKNNNNFHQTFEHASAITLPNKSQKKFEQFTAFFFIALKKLKANENILEFIQFIIHESGLHHYYLQETNKKENDQSIDYLDEFLNSINEQVNSNDKIPLLEKLSTFIERVSLLENFANENENKSVNLLTIHNAKGLEFDYVYIIGLEEEVFPHFLSLLDDEQIEEERRIFYVGVTRAKKEIVISSSEFKLKEGRLKFHVSSRFISEINKKFLKKKNLSENYYYS